MPDLRARARLLAALVAITALAGGLAACGDDEPGARASTPTPSAPTTPSATTTPPAEASTTPAVSPDDLVYLALGDSLARGIQPDQALTFERGYPRQLRDLLQKRSGKTVTLVEAGCSGATTRSFIEGGRACTPASPQPLPYTDADESTSQLAFAEAQLKARGDRPTLVTLSIGGNDVLGCVTLDAAAARRCLSAAEDAFRGRLEEIAERLASAAGKRTVLTVANLYDPALGALKLGVAPLGLVREFHTGIVDGVNPAIRDAFEGEGWIVADLARRMRQTGDVTGVSSPAVEQVCRYTWACSTTTDIHLNTDGYALSADVHGRAIRRALRSADAAFAG